MTQRITQVKSTPPARRQDQRKKPGNAPFTFLNKNFVHLPICRPSSTARRWRLSRDGTTWRLSLHYDPQTRDPRVVLTLPADIVERDSAIRRAPNRFDMDLLLRLTTLAHVASGDVVHRAALMDGRRAIEREHQHRLKYIGSETDYQPTYNTKSDAVLRAVNMSLAAEGMRGYSRLLEVGDLSRHSERNAGVVGYYEAARQLRRSKALVAEPLEFRSVRAMIIALGRNPTRPLNRNRVLQSLALWRHLTVQFARWRGGHEYQQRKFAPFLMTLDRPGNGGRGIRLALSPEYAATLRSYTIKLPLPLPLHSEATLNSALWLQAFAFTAGSTPVRDFRRLCELLGLPTTSARKCRLSFNAAIDTVNAWLWARGTRIQYEAKPHGEANVTFVRRVIERAEPEPESPIVVAEGDEEAAREYLRKLRDAERTMAEDEIIIEIEQG